uniref:glucuronosyltransferase n=1 Tax=Plectus sambesii TaxID=2011161 RepID=A0A914VET1_9BILA
LMKKGPVVLVSFGTIAQPSAFPKDWIHGLVEGLGRLSNFTVIWRFDIDLPEAAQYPNIHLVPWLPQRDLLKHPNTKLFVTHAGYNSLLESTKEGVPMLLIPLFVDQFCNAIRAVRLGLGIKVFKNEISSDSIHDAASQVLNDPRFGERAKAVDAMLSDKLISAEKALSYRMELLSKHSTKHLPRLYVARNMN